MITLPPTFDFSALISDFFLFSSPFVGIAVLFVAYRLIMRALNLAG